MPIYEYQCKDCGFRFERLQKVTDRRVRTCPECKGKVERLVSAPAIQFKGEGWYITDYSDKGKEAKKAEKAEKGEKGETKKKDKAGTGESKPAKKKESAKKAD